MPPGPRVFFPTALVDDTLYVTSESPPEIAAFRASDGSPLWALPTTDVPKGNPVVSGGMLFGYGHLGRHPRVRQRHDRRRRFDRRPPGR